MKRWFSIAWFLFGLLLAACQPATSPPATPTVPAPAVRLVTIEQTSPHYEVVVYDLNQELVALNRTVVSVTDTEEVQDVAWTEDGQNIVFASFHRETHESTLIVIKPDGSIIYSFNCGQICMYPTVSGRYMAYTVNTSATQCLSCGEWHIRDLQTNADTVIFSGEIYDQRAGIEYYWHGSNEFTIRFNQPTPLENGGYKGNFLWSTYSIQNGTPQLINTTDWEHHATQTPSSTYTLSSDCALEDPGPICGSAVISDNNGHRFAIDYVPLQFYVKSADFFTTP